MWRVIVSWMAIAGAVAALAGCGTADPHAKLPDFMLAKATEPRQPDPQPDVKQLLRDKLDAVFTAASHPRHVRVSPPRRDTSGSGWTVCVKAELTSVTGRSLGTQTYRATISGGVILDRRRVEDGDGCAAEVYEGI
jgi:predicted small lipoprotein YifL